MLRRNIGNSNRDKPSAINLEDPIISTNKSTISTDTSETLLSSLKLNCLSIFCSQMLRVK